MVRSAPPYFRKPRGRVGEQKNDMGAAKRKRQNRVPTVYHHTSTLRTNLIWMSGVIEVEGKSKGVFHPQARRDPHRRQGAPRAEGFPARRMVYDPHRCAKSADRL